MLGAKLGYTDRQIRKFETGDCEVPHVVRLAMAALFLGLEDFETESDIDEAGLRLITRALGGPTPLANRLVRRSA
jgi:hypothetical protein